MTEGGGVEAETEAFRFVQKDFPRFKVGREEITGLPCSNCSPQLLETRGVELVSGHASTTYIPNPPSLFLTVADVDNDCRGLFSSIEQSSSSLRAPNYISIICTFNK